MKLLIVLLLDPGAILRVRGEGLEQNSETEGSHSSRHEERIESGIFIPLLSSSFEINHGLYIAVEHLECGKSKLTCPESMKYTPDWKDSV